MIESDELAAARQEQETGFASLVEHYETLLMGAQYPDGLAYRTALTAVHIRALKEDADQRVSMQGAALAMAHATSAVRRMLRSQVAMQLISRAHARGGPAGVMEEIDQMLAALEQEYAGIARKSA